MEEASILAPASAMSCQIMSHNSAVIPCVPTTRFTDVRALTLRQPTRKGASDLLSATFAVIQVVASVSHHHVAVLGYS